MLHAIGVTYCCFFFLLFVFFFCFVFCFFFQAEDGIRDLVRSRGLGDVYKRQVHDVIILGALYGMYVYGYKPTIKDGIISAISMNLLAALLYPCLLYTSDAADERSSVDLGGRRIIKKKNKRILYPRTIIRLQSTTQIKQHYTISQQHVQ